MKQKLLFAAAAVCFIRALPVSAESRMFHVTLHAEGFVKDERAETYVDVLDAQDGEVISFPLQSDTAEFSLERNREYVISISDPPYGMMPDREIWIAEEETLHDHTETIQLNPFSAAVYQYIADTDLFAEGGKLEIRDEADELFCSFVPRADGKVMETVRNEEGEEEEKEVLFPAGASFVIVQSEKAEGYEPGSRKAISIPAFMKEIKEPLKFTYFLKEEPDYEYPAPPPSEWRSDLIVPSDPPASDEKEEKEKEEETETSEKDTAESLGEKPDVSAVIMQYLGLTEEPESSFFEEEEEEAPSRKWKAGFYIRMTDGQKNAITGASIAVYDAEGHQVDAWVTDGRDHLVQNERIEKGKTYTVHLLKAAKGYAGSSVDIEHTAISVAGPDYPVIEMTDRLKAAPAVQSEVKKMKKAADGLVFFAFGALIAAAAGIVLAYRRLRHSA